MTWERLLQVFQLVQRLERVARRQRVRVYRVNRLSNRSNFVLRRPAEIELGLRAFRLQRPL